MIPRSLRSRVTAVGVITLALVLGIGAWVTVRALAAGLRSDINAQNEEVLDSLVDEIAAGANVRSLLLPIGSDGTDFLILDEQGQVINASLFPASDPAVVMVGGGVIEFDPNVPISEILASDVPFGFTAEQIFVSSDDPNSIFLFDPKNWSDTRREVDSPNDGRLTIIATSPIEILDRSISRLSIALAIIVPSLVALGGCALWFATGAALNPVRRISDEANRIAPSNSGDRLPVPDTGDEIAALTRTLNGMLDRLDDGLIRQRQFISDASHELRSPLTTITGAAELVGSRTDLPEDAESTVSLLRRGAARLEAVLDDVTQLAEGDGGRPTSELDLDRLIANEVDAIAAANPEVAFDRSGVTPIVVPGHEVQLSRAIQNLVENAARHATASVTVASVVGGESVRITVDDDGPGVPVADRQRVFDRFVRLDDGRARTDGGSGLGLAIVASIARTHGGTVLCGDSPLGGARFTLTIGITP